MSERPTLGTEGVYRAAPWIVAAVAVLVFANAISNGFVLDDKPIILLNPLIQSMRGLVLAWVTPYWPPPLEIGQYRPLVTVSYVIDWAISGGDPRWFHAVNLAWHAGAAVLVWRLARDFFSPAAALVCGVLFAVHAVHVEAVANTVGRAECMATVFILGAVIAHRSPRPRVAWAAPALFALGLASKENAITFVGLALLVDLLGTRTPLAELRAKRWLYAAYVVVAIGYLVALSAIFRGRPLVVPAAVFWGVDASDRILTALSVVPHYVRLLVVPLELSSDYSPRIINLATSVDMQVVLGVVLLIGVIAGIAAAWKRAPALALALAWIIVAIAPVSNIAFATGIALAERTLYLPSVGAALAVAYLLERLAERRSTVALAAASVLVAGMAIRTWTRTPTWRDSRTWLETLITAHPESYKAHEYFGQLLAALEKYPEADVEFTSARVLFQRDPYLYQAASDVALRMRDFPRALALVDTAVALYPGLASAHVKRADMRFQLGDLSGAIESARLGHSLTADSATKVEALLIEAIALHRLGRLADAERAYRTALESHPRAWQLHIGLADVLLARFDTTGAAVVAGRAVEAASTDSIGRAAALAMQQRLRRPSSPSSGTRTIP